jgi:hypothetical protein
MGRLMSQELDRSQSPWEAWIVEGLEGGRWAIISKVHHCMVDGVAGVDLISLVLDSTLDTAPVCATSGIGAGAVVDAACRRRHHRPAQGAR